MRKFEGEEIDGYTVIMRQYNGSFPMPLARGEKVLLLVEAEVRSVSFNENLKTGRVYREHILHVKEVRPDVTLAPGGGEPA